MRRRTTPRGARVLVAALLLLAVGGLFADLWVQLQTTFQADARRAATERQAVPFLQAVTDLTADLVDTRSAAVLGQTEPPVDLKASMTVVSGLDASLGGSLQTHQRWIDLVAGIEGVQAERPTGRAASDRYTDLVGMANDLVRALGTTSLLSSDLSSNGQSLARGAIEELPTIVIAAGRAADVNALAATPADTADLVEVAAARRDIATAGSQLFTAMITAVDTGARPTFTAAIADQLDALRTAIGLVAGPTALHQAATTVPPATLSADAGRVRQQARVVTRTVLGELDAVLAARQEALQNRQNIANATAGAGLVLALIVLWWSASSPALGPVGPETADPDVASVSVQLPAVEARELLAREELIAVARGRRTRKRDGADHAR